MYNWNGDNVACACRSCADALQRRLYTDELKDNIKKANTSLKRLKTCLRNAQQNSSYSKHYSKQWEVINDTDIQNSMQNIKDMLNFLENNFVLFADDVAVS